MNIYKYSKSQMLVFLKKKINNKNCIILDQVNFTKKKYLQNKREIISKIIKKYNSQRIIIRSSSLDEDKTLSNAGKYKSFLNVNALYNIIEKKIDELIVNLLNPKDIIFVQEYISKISISGVIFTGTYENEAPYYVINYDYSKKTDLVTSGSYNPTMKILNIYRYKKKIPKEFKNLINIVKKIELIFPKHLLDIEFAIENNKVYIFQCRSLKFLDKTKVSSYIDDELVYIRKKIKKIFLPNPSLFGSYSLLSNMADWNPAEMIGA